MWHLDSVATCISVLAGTSLASLASGSLTVSALFYGATRPTIGPIGPAGWLELWAAPGGPESFLQLCLLASQRPEDFKTYQTCTAAQRWARNIPGRSTCHTGEARKPTPTFCHLLSKTLRTPGLKAPPLQHPVVLPCGGWWRRFRMLSWQVASNESLLLLLWCV